MAAANPTERTDVARLAAHARWARQAQRNPAAVAPGRAMMRQRFDAEIDESITDADVRRRMVDRRLKTWMIQARRRRFREDQIIDAAIALLDSNAPDAA